MVYGHIKEKAVKRLAVAFILLCALWVNVYSEDITVGDTLGLYYPTHVNNVMAPWDTMVADIIHCGVYLERVAMVGTGGGEWHGVYIATFPGSFAAAYKAVYAGDTTAGEPQYFGVLDTTAFHGSAAGLTAQEIIDSLVNQGYIPGIGSGEFACTLEVRDSSLQAGIQGVVIAIKNNAQSITLRSGVTNGDGLAFFNLDPLTTGNSYKLWLQELGYNFTFPETLDLRGDTTAVFYGTAFDVGSPPVANKCRVYDQIFDFELDSLSGVEIAVRLDVPKDSILRYEGYPISPYRKTYTTGVNGRWSFDLVPNSDYSPSGTVYIFKFKHPVVGGPYFIYEDTATVPDQETARYREISGKM